MRIEHLTKSKKIIILLLCILGIYTFGCSSQRAKKEKTKATKETVSLQKGVEEKILSFNLEGYTDKGKKKWEVAGESADILQDVVNLAKVVVKAYGQESTLILKADKGCYDKKNKAVKFERNVTATTTDGVRLTTDSLCWAAEAEKITTEDSVVIEKEDIILTGKGGIANPKLKQVQLQEDVKVKMPATVVTCQGPLEFDYENAIAIFNNDVKVEDQRGQIYADKLIAYFDKDNKKLKEVVAEGNVRVVRGENNTFSQKARYTQEDGKVVLTGSPRLIIYSEEEGIKVPSFLDK